MGLISKAEFARRGGVSRAAVTKAEKRGDLLTDETGLIDPDLKQNRYVLAQFQRHAAERAHTLRPSRRAAPKVVDSLSAGVHAAQFGYESTDGTWCPVVSRFYRDTDTYPELEVLHFTGSIHAPDGERVTFQPEGSDDRIALELRESPPGAFSKGGSDVF